MESYEKKKEEECDFAHNPKQLLPAELEKPILALLSPNHPLLQKFQQLLKEYLLRTKEQLSNEIAEMKYQIKLKQQQREDQGAKLYDMQQEIDYQNDQLEEYTRVIKKHVGHRQTEEQAVVQLKTEFQRKLTLNKEQKTLYNKRMMELEHMQHLENNIHKWTYEMEDEVKNAKRVLSRDAQLQQQLSEDKKKSDMLFLHLNMEVKKRENELDTIRDELLEMRQVISVLNGSITHANTDLEVLQNEHKRLNQAWGEVIVAISHRDKIMHQVRESTEKEKEFMKLSTSGIEAIKKQIARELDQNEKLESFKTRLVNDFTNLKKECQKESDTLLSLGTKLQDLPNWLEQTELDLQEANREGNHLEIEIRRIQWKMDKQSNKKFEIEENILKLAQDHLITDKASEYRFKLLRNAQNQRRGMELTLAQSQNSLAEALLEIEIFKGRLFKLNQDNDQLMNKLGSEESEYDHLKMELKMIETQLDLKMKRIDRLTNQLDQLLRSTEGSEVSPTELKIRGLEKVLQAAEQQIREHQQFWLMLQNHFVNLSQKRNNQLNEIQITHKQLSIIKQKSLKIDNALEKSEVVTQELKRDVQVYTSKVELLNEKFYKKHQKNELEENECELVHSQLLQKLKDGEMQVLGVEAEIDELQIELEHYKNLVLDKHRETLSWETKYKLIEETMHWRKQECSQNSEIGIMKTEIHRMQLRYKQLKRAQEKLMQDLEHCIMHREQIFIAASTKQRVESKSQRSKAVTTTQQRTTDLCNKLKQIQNEIGSLADLKLINITREQEVINCTNKQLRSNIEREIAEDKQLQTKIEESMLLKHLNLETIVHRQNRAKSYRKLKGSSQIIKLSRSETAIEAQTHKQNDTNDSLIDAIQSLILGFPEKKIFFTKILQILKY